MADEQSLTVKQVAARWQCDAQTVRALIKQGDLPAFRVGNEYRIKESAVTEFEESWNPTIGVRQS